MLNLALTLDGRMAAGRWQTFFKVLQRQNMQNQTIFELYILMT